jgi:hydroxypyruvate isomerase
MKYSLCIGAFPGQDVFYHLEKVKEHGFHGLEFYKWKNLDIPAVQEAQARLGVGISAICTTFFNLVDETKREDYLAGLKETIEASKQLGVKSIISQTGNEIEGLSRKEQKKAMIETLKQCAPLCEQADVILEIEPLNGLVNHKGHFLQRSDEATEIISEVNSPHIKLVFDVYHQQITEGNVIRNATNYLPYINHYHIADNPGRKQPGTGELNYVNILKAIKETGFSGFVGLECGFTIDTDEAIMRFNSDILSKL